MEGFIRTLLEMSLYGSIAIAVVLLFRLIFKKVPKKVMILIWIVAAFRLLCPYNFGTGVGIAGLIPETKLMQAAPAVSDTVVSSEDIKTIKTVSSPEIKTTSREISAPKIENTVRTSVNRDVISEAEEETAKILPDMKPVDIVFALWLAGMAANALLAAYKSVKVILKTRTFKIADGGYLESDEIATPFAVGIIKPTICIPSDLDEGEREYMLLHEKIHLKNYDPALKCLALGIVCLHWFNPLVWLAYRLFLSDLEMRCDEEVVDRLGDSIRKRYCLSIVNHSVDESGFRVISTAFAAKTFGGMEVKMRINNLIKYKKMPVIASALILAIAGGSAFALSACAVGEAKDTERLTADNTSMSVNIEKTSAVTDNTGSTDNADTDWEKYYLDKYGHDKIFEGLESDSIDKVIYYEDRVQAMYTLNGRDSGVYTFYPDIEFPSLEDFDAYFSAANYTINDLSTLVPLDPSVVVTIRAWDKNFIDLKEYYPDNDDLHYPELSSTDTIYKKTYTDHPVDIWYDTTDKTLHVADRSWMNEQGCHTEMIDGTSLTWTDETREWKDKCIDEIGLDNITAGLEADKIKSCDFSQNGTVWVCYTLGGEEPFYYSYTPEKTFASLEEFDSFFSPATVCDIAFRGFEAGAPVSWTSIGVIDKSEVTEVYSDLFIDVSLPIVTQDDNEYRKYYVFGPDNEVILDIRYDKATNTVRADDRVMRWLGISFTPGYVDIGVIRDMDAFTNGDVDG